MKLLLLGIFVSDWRRKLTALGLAFALWLWVDGLVAEQQPHTLRIVISPVERAVEPGTLQIRVPEGWTLTAGPGTSSIDEVQFSLFGSAAQIEAFLATGFSASFDPELDRAERQDRVNMSILVSDLQWSRPDQADTLLADSESDRSLSFQFVKLQTVAIELGPHLFNIEGGVADGYIALDKELSFDLSEIRIVGPSTTLGPTFGKINDRLDAFESGDMDLVQLYPPLLEALVLDGQRRDMHVELRLHPNHVRAGIRLVEGRVSVDLPVRLLDPDPRPIPLEADMLTIVPDPEGEWEAPVWSQTAWTLICSFTTLGAVRGETGNRFGMRSFEFGSRRSTATKR